MVIATWINGLREGKGEIVVAAIEERDRGDVDGGRRCKRVVVEVVVIV